MQCPIPIPTLRLREKCPFIAPLTLKAGCAVIQRENWQRLRRRRGKSNGDHRGFWGEEEGRRKEDENEGREGGYEGKKNQEFEKGKEGRAEGEEEGRRGDMTKEEGEWKRG
jgi:hypothetical protein